MDKKLIFIFFIFTFILNTKCAKEEEENYDEYPNDDYYGTLHFKAFLKKYLTEKNLLNSEKIISKEEMKKIFEDVISEGDPEGAAAYMGDIFNDLTTYFVNTYYSGRSEIRGKEIIDLFDIRVITQKFEQMLGPPDDEEEEMEYDSKDKIGKPESNL